MPVDPYEDDDDAKKEQGSAGRFKEFDCPDCSANNPCDPPFGDGDELLCHYCGSEFVVKLSDEGRPKFRAL
jgi:hypothetical protein